MATFCGKLKTIAKKADVENAELLRVRKTPDSTRDHLPDSMQTRGRSPSSDCHVRGSEPSHGASDFLDQEQHAKPVRVDELAQIAGMGVSTLHHHFHMLTHMSPLQYQKQLWLQAAQGRTLLDGLDASTVAFEVGYEGVSQFNREYSRYIGQPPMRDIKAL
ncbi:MAG: AraC family transcriptional regulator [Candidatus Sulfotelmatobacter sp.]